MLRRTWIDNTSNEEAQQRMGHYGNHGFQGSGITGHLETEKEEIDREIEGERELERTGSNVDIRIFKSFLVLEEN